MYKDNEKSAENRKKTFTLLGADMHSYQSDTPGIFGGYRPSKLYGRLDCPSALRAIAKGGYVKHRVFNCFTDCPGRYNSATIFKNSSLHFSFVIWTLSS